MRNKELIGRRRGMATLLGLLVIGTGFLSALLFSAYSYGDAASDYSTLCSGCHSSPAGPSSSPIPIDLSKYTNSSIELKISNSMPLGDAGACVGECAKNLANLILPPTDVELPLATSHLSNNLVGPGPLTSIFSARGSDCYAAPCTLQWDFGDGTKETQVTYHRNTNNIASLEHTFTSVGSHRVTLDMTDFLGQTSPTNVVYAYVVEEESLSEYVDTCKDELEFDDGDIPNDLNCATGHLFADDGKAVHDYMDHRAVTDEVDLLFACRWLQNDKGENFVTEPPFVLGISIEMLMHNRSNGKTCFFKAKNHDIPVTRPDGTPGTVKAASVEIVSPTVAANALPGSTEYEYWDQPMELAQSISCVDCHVAGPYIATPRIAPFLHRFGLLNDGHDTFGRAMTGYFGSFGKYQIVGETFKFMNHFAAFNNEQNTCANGCHSVGYNSIKLGLQAGVPPDGGVPGSLIPSIRSVISGAGEVGIGDVMPANSPPTGSANTSLYTWINRDNPFLEGSEGDSETFVQARDEFTELLSYCEDPGYITAHTVDSDVELRPAQFSDTLTVFNAQDGVICEKSKQSDGQCNDFRVRYQCTDSDGVISYTGWYNTDSPSYNGDFERRSDHSNVCVGKTVSGIEASSSISTGWTAAVAGPVDRLAQFDRYGLVCNNSDQNDGQCENYVVKFNYCSDAPVAYTGNVVSAWSGRLLTASTTQNNAATKAQPYEGSWSSQDWLIEPISGTGYVRLKNVWTESYLNSQSDAEYADVVMYEYVDDWGSEKWIIEPVLGSTEVRFKNVWTGKYLTVTNAGDYADIKSQGLDPSWPSQRWRIE